MGIAQNDISQPFINELKTIEENVLKQVFRKISPLFLATNLNSELPREQMAILIDQTKDEAIRKQAIQKINLLTKKVFLF